MAESVLKRKSSRWTLVWETSDATVSFAGQQTIPIDLTGYSFILVETLFSTTTATSDFGVYQMIPIGTTDTPTSKLLRGYNVNFRSTSTGNPNVYTRAVKAVTSSGVEFGDAKYRNAATTNSTTIANGNMVPTRIWAK